MIAASSLRTYYSKLETLWSRDTKWSQAARGTPPSSGAGEHAGVGASGSAEEHQGTVIGELCNDSEWLREQVVQALADSRVPDGGTMHWLSDTSQV